MADRTDHVIRPGADKADVMTTEDTGLIEAVRRRAYELWEQDGRREGLDLEYWTRAEQEVLGRAPPLA